MSDLLELNPTESNKIGFKLKIEGNTKKLSNNNGVEEKPIIRFLLSNENNPTTSFVFLADKETINDEVIVSLPNLKNIINENELYVGKLEVILNGKYFTPSTINLRFNEPTKVELLSNKVEVIPNNEELVVVEEKVITTEEKPAETPVALNKNIIMASVIGNVEDDLKEINKLFQAKCREYKITKLNKYNKTIIKKLYKSAEIEYNNSVRII
jgi:hypothetical protein